VIGPASVHAGRMFSRGPNAAVIVRLHDVAQSSRARLELRLRYWVQAPQVVDRLAQLQRFLGRARPPPPPPPRAAPLRPVLLCYGYE
jgi:hypothetical protein